MPKKRIRLGNTAMPYEFLNSYELRQLHLKDSQYSNSNKITKNYGCPKCGNHKSEDIIDLRVDFAECRLCGTTFVPVHKFKGKHGRKQE
jgi:hypothetical protein